MADFTLQMVDALAGAVLTAVATWLWVKIIAPVYRAAIYKGVQLNGNWTLEQDEKTADGEGFLISGSWSVSLRQRAHQLTGEATVNLRRDTGTPEMFEYQISGHTYDRFVSLEMRGKNPLCIACSTFLLEVNGGGDTMEGYRSFYGRRKNQIRSAYCKWIRSGSSTCGSR